MARPIVGIIANSHVIEGSFPIHGVGRMSCEAVAEAADCVPLMIPADPRLVRVPELLEVCAGFVLTGGAPNVHPEEYGEAATEAHGRFDRSRDAVTLPLVRACVERGQPFFGICRGFQEVNVAMGGTLHPEIRDLPGRMNHRMLPVEALDEQYALRHPVRFAHGGAFHRLLGVEEVMTNSLHGQGIMKPGARIAIEGQTQDGTAEALVVQGAPGFTLSVQWHPEFRAAQDPVSRPLFAAFGAAVHAWADGRRLRPARSA